MPVIAACILQYYDSADLVEWLSDEQLYPIVNHPIVWRHHWVPVSCNRSEWRAFFKHVHLWRKLAIDAPPGCNDGFNDEDMNVIGDILGKMHGVRITRCNITDVTVLRGVDTVDLSGCEHVTDVSALGGARRLNLSRCYGVVDVSALGNVYALNLTGCINVVDVSTLGNVYSLNLSKCISVMDVSALGGVHRLNLFQCVRVSDVSALGNVHSLNLSRCICVRDVSALGDVPRLIMDRH